MLFFKELSELTGEPLREVAFEPPKGYEWAFLELPGMELLDFTQVAMQALRGGVLTKEANSTKALLEAFHAMHAACFLYFIKEWKRRGFGIADFGFLKKEIETLAQKKPTKLLASLKAFDEGRSSQLDAIVESGKKKGEKEAKF